MQFRIADTFTDSLAKLTGDEQKAVKTTAFDLQMNPSGHGMQFHKLDKAKDKRFWSVQADEIGIIVRSGDQTARALKAIKSTDLKPVSVMTMHLAKGLEFRAVVVMACDDEVIPLQTRLETVADDSDLEEVYNTERHLLYVACTRARDQLMVCGVDPASEFLDDLSITNG